MFVFFFSTTFVSEVAAFHFGLDGSSNLTHTGHHDKDVGEELAGHHFAVALLVEVDALSILIMGSSSLWRSLLMKPIA